MKNSDSDAYYSETTKIVKEARKLVETSFEYICEIDGFKLFRKPK